MFISYNVHSQCNGPGIPWTKFRNITLSAPTPSANYQVKVTLNAGQYANMQASGNDLRFYDPIASCDYWIETWNTSGTSTIWVEVVNASASQLVMYYGNPSATAASNAINTFVFYDDFSGTSINTSKWDVKTGTTSTISVSGGQLTLNSGLTDTQGSQIIAKTGFLSSSGTIIETTLGTNGTSLSTLCGSRASFCGATSLSGSTNYFNLDVSASPNYACWSAGRNGIVTSSVFNRNTVATTYGPNMSIVNAGEKVGTAIENGRVEYFRNSISQFTNTTTTPTGIVYPVLSYMRYSCQPASNGTLRIDDIRVRKFLNTYNPTVSIGTEFLYLTPTFSAVAAICSGESLSILPTISNNGITGTWSPALDNTATTTYTFTPATECATTATLTITVNPIITPTFSAVAAICSGESLSTLPTTSNNSITGTWSPVLDNTATTTYTFTPTAGQCATTATLTITVNSTTLGSLTTTAAGYFTWASPLGSGLTYANSGTYTFMSTNVFGCANVATLNLTITPGTPVNTFLIGSSCGATISYLGVTITTPFVSGAPSYLFRVKNLSTNATLLVTRPVNSFALSNYAGITLATPYQIEVSTNGGVTYGLPCIVITPSPTSTIGAQCGTTLVSMTQFVNCTFVSTVTGYRFRITKLSDNTVQIFDSGLNRFNFNQLPNRSFNSIYSVEVALKNTNGTYLPYNASCTISTPNFPTSEVRLSQCDYNALSNTESFVATLVSGATEYRIIVFNLGIGYSYTIDRPVNTFNLNMFPGLLAGTTYSVQVAVKIGGEFGPYGKVCNVTTPGGETRMSVIIKEEFFKAIASPNPFAEDFKLEVKTSNESAIQIRVYDMLGKQIENKNVAVSEIENLIIGANYNSGVYNVIVSQGENTQTLRVIKR